MLVQPSGVGSRPAEGVPGVQGGHRKTTWREERVSAPGARPRTAALAGQPERPSRLRPVPCRPRPRPLLDQGPGGGLSASAKATPSMHCHPLGLVGPASCHRPSAFEARGAGEGTREDPGGGRPSGRAESAGPATRGYWCLHGVRREWGETLASRGQGGRGFRHAAPPDARGAVNVTAGSRPPAGSPGSVVRLLHAAPVQTHSRYLERFLHQTRNNRWQQLTADPIRKWTSLSLEA